MSSKIYGITKENIERLKRYQAFEIQISRLLGGWLPGIARWEIKHDVGLHIWESAENSRDQWEFYYDISRHCWDEVRHSQLGCRRLEQLGHHISDFPHSVGSYAWRQLFHPVIRYCALTYVIEADSFSMKHEMYQHYQDQNDHESAQAIMYDIIDETLHVRWGAKWVSPLMKQFGYTQTVNELVDECRDIVLSHSVSPAQIKQAERVIASKSR